MDTVAVLLEAGADVNAVDEDGVSALMWASGSEVRTVHIYALLFPYIRVTMASQ